METLLTHRLCQQTTMNGGILLTKKVIAYNRLEKPVLDRLKEKYDIRFFKDIDTTSDPSFLAHLREAAGIIGLDLKVNETLLQNAPHLKIISNVSVGYNNLDLAALHKHGIMATNTPGILTDTVADSIFGILLATARRMPELDHLVKSGQWKHILEAEHYGTDVHHKTLGIIGMGRIGKAIAKRAHYGFDMSILYHSRSRKPDAENEFQATYCSLDELLATADFIILMTPLTPDTNKMIGKREFQLMQPSAIFVNGSRGQTIDEQALTDALENREIRAAGLDVFQQEPVEDDNPLLALNNAVTLPHVGSSTHETELKMSSLAATNLEAGLRGEKPPNLIDETVCTVD